MNKFVSHYLFCLEQLKHGVQWSEKSSVATIRVQIWLVFTCASTKIFFISLSLCKARVCALKCALSCCAKLGASKMHHRIFCTTVPHRVFLVDISDFCSSSLIEKGAKPNDFSKPSHVLLALKTVKSMNLVKQFIKSFWAPFIYLANAYLSNKSQ